MPADSNTTAQTKASIALATHNGMDFLPAFLDSLASSTYPVFELVHYDDESRDCSKDYVEKWCSRLPCRYTAVPPIPHGNEPKKLRIAKNFIHCLKHCSGDVVFFADQDDLWHPEKIGAHIQVHLAFRASLVCSRMRMIDAFGIALERATHETGIARPFGQPHKITNLQGCLTSVQKCVAEVMVDYMEQRGLDLCHDSISVLCAVGALGGLYHLDRVLTDYRRHGSNASLPPVAARRPLSQRLKSLSDPGSYLAEIEHAHRLAFALRLVQQRSCDGPSFAGILRHAENLLRLHDRVSAGPPLAASLQLLLSARAWQELTASNLLRGIAWVLRTRRGAP